MYKIVGRQCINFISFKCRLWYYIYIILFVPPPTSNSPQQSTYIYVQSKLCTDVVSPIVDFRSFVLRLDWQDAGKEGKVGERQNVVHPPGADARNLLEDKVGGVDEVEPEHQPVAEDALGHGVALLHAELEGHGGGAGGQADAEDEEGVEEGLERGDLVKPDQALGDEGGRAADEAGGAQQEDDAGLHMLPELVHTDGDQDARSDGGETYEDTWKVVLCRRILAWDDKRQKSEFHHVHLELGAQGYIETSLFY